MYYPGAVPSRPKLRRPVGSVSRQRGAPGGHRYTHKSVESAGGRSTARVPDAGVAAERGRGVPGGIAQQRLFEFRHATGSPEHAAEGPGVGRHSRPHAKPPPQKNASSARNRQRAPAKTSGRGENFSPGMGLFVQQKGRHHDAFFVRATRVYYFLFLLFSFSDPRVVHA